MKRTSSPTRPLRLVALTALALPLLAAAPARKQAPAKPAATVAPAAEKPAPGKFTHPKLRGWINGTPDTGQFLADSVWLLKVGPRVTTAGRFVEDYFASYPEYRPGQDSLGRVQFLQSILNKDVLGLTALALNQPLGFEDRLAIREARERALARAVYQRFVSDSVKTTDADIRALWETYAWDQHVRHILFADRNAADKVRRELISGRIAWSAAVKKYSRPDGTEGTDGDLGWVARDKMDRPVANVIFALKPGEISRPVRDARGWHIVQCVERRPRPPLSFEAMRPALREDITSAKSQEFTERVLELLRVQEGMTFDTANAVFASSHFGATVKMTAGVGTSLELDGSVPELSNDDTSRVIARWNQGRFTIGSLLHAFMEIPPLMRPSLNVPEAVIGFIETLLLQPSIAEYGAQHGLENDPDVLQVVAMKREQLLVEHLYQDSVGTKVWVSKEERQRYYEKNKSRFFTFPSVDFAAIVRSSKAGADSVEKALRSGVQAAAILAADSARGLVSGSIQHRNSSEHGPYQKSLFEEMRTGDIQVRGPDRNGDYAILQLLHFDGGRQLSYAEVEQNVDESVQNMKSDAALQALVGRLKKRYEVRWRPELVMLVKLVDPTLD